MSSVASSALVGALVEAKLDELSEIKCKLQFLGETFAAKHVTCRRASEKKRIIEEVEILGFLNHPQIMRLHRVFADIENSLEDEIVLILEYLSGTGML